MRLKFENIKDNEVPDQDEIDEKVLEIVEGDQDLADRLSEFVPEAYARAYFGQSRFKVKAWEDYFYRETPDGGKTEECPLVYEHVWTVALCCALEDLEAGAKLNDMYPVMGNAALWNLIIERFNAGENIEGSTFKPLGFSRPAPMPVQPPPENRAEEEDNDNSESIFADEE